MIHSLSIMNPEEMLTRILLSPDSFTLTPEQIRWATELAQQPAFSQTPDQQWQAYLTALALLGVEQWLQERAPNLRFSSAWLQGRSQLHSPQVPLAQIVDQIISPADAIGRVTVGTFQLQLVATDNPGDDIVLMSKASVDQPAQRPDFYLLVEVLEEMAQVSVSGHLQPNLLQAQRQSTPLELEDEQTYAVPLNWFEPNTGKLLLYLQHLAPAAFAATAPAPSPAPSLTQHAINAGLWLSNQLDQLAQDLSWVLLPPTPSLGMRSLDQLNAVMTKLMERKEIEFPPQIGNVYHDLQFAQATLRLYAVAWELATEETPEWMLLLILGTPNGTRLSAGVRLQVRDETQLLIDTALENDQDAYLYGQVRGEQNERFYVTVSLETEQIELPPIGFSPEA